MLRIVKPLTFFSILILAFVVCVACGPPRQAARYELTPIQQAQIQKNFDSLKNHMVHVDDQFSQDEMDKIFAGTKAWETATKGIVKFSFFWYERLADRDIHDKMDRNIVIKIHSSHPFVYQQDRKKQANVIGFVHWVGEHFYFGIVYDRIFTESQYYGVVLHEVGHAIGLDHFDSAFAIMNSMVSPMHDCLTENDLNLFCQSYHCLTKDMLFCQK